MRTRYTLKTTKDRDIGDGANDGFYVGIKQDSVSIYGQNLHKLENVLPPLNAILNHDTIQVVHMFITSL